MRHLTADEETGVRSCRPRRPQSGITIPLRMPKKTRHEDRPSARQGPPPSARARRAAAGRRQSRVERKHTINDIARLANVSKKTVSRVINESPFVREETRARIDEIIKRVGFTPDPQARALAFRRSFLIGLIYDNPNAPYVINFQEGALGALRRVGLRAGGASVRSPQRRIPDRHPPLHHAPEARRRGDAAAGLGESDARGDAAQAGMPVHPRDRRGARRSEEPGACRWTASPPPKSPSISRSSATGASR